MKILFIIYVFLTGLLGIIGTYNDETDEEQNPKPAWAFILSLIFFMISPIIAFLCGLI